MAKKTELTVIEQPEFTEVVQKSKIELTKAQEHALAFAPLMQQYHELASVMADLDKVNPTTDHAKKARETRLKMVKIRTGAEIVKDDRKSVLLIESNLIQDLHNVVKNTCALTESEFLAIEKHQERIESERLEKIAESRKLLLEPYGEINQFVDLKAMDDITFEKYLSNEKLAFETREEKAKKAELDRIAAEEKAEQERKDKEEADRVEQERIKAENEKLRLENEAKEKELAKEREAQAEKDRLAKIESERLTKIQADKDAEIAKLKAEQEAEKQRKEKELADERLRVEAEEADKKAKEKAALLAPDKEKIKAFFAKFETLTKEFPELTSEEGKSMALKVKEAMGLVRGIIINESKKLM